MKIRVKPWLFLLERAVLSMHRRKRPSIGSRNASAWVGEHGELFAYFHVRREGYRVVARRWRAPNHNGEVDLIAWDDDTLCFLEVKTRTRRDRFAAEYALHRSKREALQRMARAYVHELPWCGNEPSNPRIRFDSISVYLEEGSAAIELQKGFL